MNGSIPDYNHKRVWAIAGAMAIFWLLVAIWVSERIPSTETIPYALEVWILFGWIAGIYPSFSALLLRPLFSLLFRQQAVDDLDAAHGVLLVLAASGVGVWAITKLLGYG